MEIKEPLMKLLVQNYEPNSLVERPFKDYHAVFKTDEDGRPILLFLGKKQADGRVKGERFTRKLKLDKDGKIVKDHWDHKGKAS